MFFDNKGFVFWRYSCKHLDFLIHEIIWSFFDKVIIYGIELIGVIRKSKRIYCSSLFYYFSIFVVTQLHNFNLPIFLIVLSLYNDNSFIIWHYTDHKGSFNSQIDIISSNNFGINQGISQSMNRLNSIFF